MFIDIYYMIKSKLLFNSHMLQVYRLFVWVIYNNLKIDIKILNQNKLYIYTNINVNTMY